MTQYIHRDSGQTYLYVKTCKTKVNGMWEDGIIYEAEFGDTYVRTQKDFDNRFKRFATDKEFCLAAMSKFREAFEGISGSDVKEQLIESGFIHVDEFGRTFVRVEDMGVKEEGGNEPKQ